MSLLTLIDTCSLINPDDQLSNFTVAVGNRFERRYFDRDGFTVCAYVEGALNQAETRTVKCDKPVVGRYVTVYLNTENALTICELEVHGTDIGNNFSLGILG